MPSLAKKILIGLALCSCAILLSGCIYFRLLELKKQFANMEEFIEVDKSAGLALSFREPVLLADDIRFLGLGPSVRRVDGETEAWEIVLEKDLSEGEEEAGKFDLEAALSFREGLLTQFSLNERYFIVIPQDLYVELLKALGKAKIRILKRSVTIEDSIGEGLTLDLPSIADAKQILGRPTATSLEEGIVSYTYRYRHRTGNGKLGKKVYWARLKFDAETGSIYSFATNIVIPIDVPLSPAARDAEGS